MRQRAANALLWLVFGAVLLSVLMPNDDIRWMREHWAWFNYPMLLIELADSAVNLVHAILFMLLGGAVRLALPAWRKERVALGLLLFGVATELVQFLVPGRHPRITDVVVDVVAGLLGWTAVRVLSR